MSDLATAGLAAGVLTKDGSSPRTISPFEFLPGWVIYGPLVIYWILLGLRHRDMALPTLANPRITTGGLCGESKAGILDQVTGAARSWIAPYAAFVTGRGDSAHVLRIMAELQLGFPVVIKPDVGCKGAGVKLVRSEAQLHEVVAAFPRGITLLVQKFIPYEGEAGVYYSRAPGAVQGEILSLTLKASPRVVGDGVSTIQQLVMNHARAKEAPHVYLPRLGARVDEVLPAGEILPLVFTGNHSKGSVFRDAGALITAALTERIDQILQGLPEFHHGRIDLRFASIPELMRGEAIEIIEINGIGAEPIQMWDPGKRLLDIYAAQFRFYGRAFRIGRAMRRRGYLSRGAFDMLWHWLAQSRLIASYPPSD